MSTQTGIVDWSSEKIANGASVVLPPTHRGASNIVYFKDEKAMAYRPAELPYSANWNSLTHDGKRFIVADSGNSRLQATSVDGKNWVDAGT